MFANFESGQESLWAGARQIFAGERAKITGSGEQRIQAERRLLERIFARIMQTKK
jgi:hypothetical protein